ADVVADGEIAAPALLAGAGIGGGEVGAATAAAAGVHGAEAGGDAAVAVGGAVLIGIAAAAAATEDIAEDLGEVGGGAVLHAVDMQGGFVGGVLALVEAVDPGADAVEVVGAGGDHEDAVEALEGHHPDDAGEAGSGDALGA